VNARRPPAPAQQLRAISTHALASWLQSVPSGQHLERIGPPSAHSSWYARRAAPHSRLSLTTRHLGRAAGPDCAAD
jgi:hypothetical protein